MIKIKLFGNFEIHINCKLFYSLYIIKSENLYTTILSKIFAMITTFDNE